MSQDKHPLYELRRKRGMTQWELACEADVTQTVVSRIENGNKVRTTTALRIARALGVAVNDIFAEDDINDARGRRAGVKAPLQKKEHRHKLHEVRLQHDLSQDELAQAADIAAMTVSRVERGVDRPTPETARRIAQALECDVNDIWADEEIAKQGGPVGKQGVSRKKPAPKEVRCDACGIVNPAHLEECQMCCESLAETQNA